MMTGAYMAGLLTGFGVSAVLTSIGQDNAGMAVFYTLMTLIWPLVLLIRLITLKATVFLTPDGK
jgi:hypothetical protein